MGDPQPEHNHYYPDGLIPVTPQARIFGFDMPMYVSQRVWDATCLPVTGKNSESTDKRIFELLQGTFSGLTKKMAVRDDFVSFTFKHWCTERGRPRAKKKMKVNLGVRLMLMPEDDSPWLLVYVDRIDTTAILKKGDPPDESEHEPASEASPNIERPAPIEVYTDDESGDEVFLSSDY